MTKRCVWHIINNTVRFANIRWKGNGNFLRINWALIPLLLDILYFHERLVTFILLVKSDVNSTFFFISVF
jgi:hypothetical protein